MRFLKIIAFLFVTNTIQAQIHNAYQMGSIGMTGSIHPIFSGPVLIEGSDCFVVSNGIKTLELSKEGYFSTACRLVLLSESGIRLNAYPNPVKNTVTIKSSEQFLSINQLGIQLYLMDMGGRLIQTFHTDIKNLNIGYQIKMGAYSNGSYLIKVASGTNNFQVLPIIKSN
ncbi:MAG: T9SS type A sorting domain-containing protein [Bacteroidota bacterium]